MPDKLLNDKDGLLELLKKLWMPVAGFLGAITLAYNFYQLWLGDQATVTYFLSGGGLIVLVISLIWVGYKKTVIELPTIILSETQTKATREEKRLAYPQFHKLARIMIGGILIGVIAGAAVLIQHRRALKEKLVVVIATFDGPEDVYGLHNEIIERLNADFSTDSEVVIVPRKDVITPDDGSSVARALGKRYLADIVVWGWYRPTENPNVTIHIENLTLERLSILDDSTVLDPDTTLDELNSFSFQQQTGHEASGLVSFLAGFIKYSAKDYTNAIIRFDVSIKYLQENPHVFENISEIYFYRANSHAHLGNFEQAIADFSRVLEIDPQQSSTYYNRGYVYGNQGEYERAIHDFDKAIEIDSTDASAYLNRGFSLYKLEQFDLAIQSYNEAIKIDPQNVLGYNNRGVVYSTLGQYETAIQNYDKALEIDPEYEDSYSNRGAAYREMGQPERAIIDLDKAIDINPKHAFAHHNRGLAYYDLGKYDIAIQDFSEAIAIGPPNVEFYYRRGNTYSSWEKYIPAIQDYSKAIEMNPQSSDYYYNRGRAYQLTDQNLEAIQDYTKSIELDPAPADVYRNRGTAYFNLGSYEMAIQDFSMAIEIDPSYAPVYKNRGIIYQKLGKTAEAEADFKKYEELTGEG